MTISARQSNALFAALGQVGPHGHLCSIYESRQDQLAVTIPFLRIGLDRGEKCIYITDNCTGGNIREALGAEGVDVDRAIASGALVLTTKEQAYLKHGSFNPDWMFTFWKEATASAMSEGFSGLRATGETEWVLRDSVGLERWMEYENRVTHMLAENNCFLLCQYNRQPFPPDFILDVIRTHSTIVYASTVCRNLYHVPPAACVKTDQSAREVERLLTNIREREQVEQISREQESQLLLAQELLVQGISKRKRAEALVSAEKHTLQMIAEGAVLRDVLDALCRAIDEQAPGLMSMVCTIDPEGQHLRPIAGPRVPEGWKQHMTPTAIGPCAGSCGTAAFRAEPVVVPDIATDSLWEGCRDAAVTYGLRACWSSPLVSTTGDMLGTFAMYYSEPRNPEEHDLTLMERATQVARIAMERELVRKALRDTQQRFRLMVEGVKDYAIFMLDTEGRVSSWNAGAERIKGYREEEILGQHFSRFYPPEEVAQGKPEELLALATATGRVEHEGWRLRKDGTRFWADVVITAVRDEEDKLIGFSKVTRDMTERKEAEATLLVLKDELAAELTVMIGLHEFSTRLMESTEIQPLLEEVLNATIALQKADFGNIQLYNPQTHALEIAAQRGFQQDFLDYFSSVHEGTAACGAALQRRERVIIEDVQTDPVFEPHRKIAASAGFRAVQSTPLFSRKGELLGMLSTHFRQPHRPLERDLRLTDLYLVHAAELIERKRAEEELREANDRNKMTLDSMTDRFFAFDSQWRFTYFNKHAEEQLAALNKNAASLIGKVLWEEFPNPPVEEAFRRAMSERVVITHEHYYPPLGEWVENRIYPSPDGGLAVFQRYVTERKRAEEELRRSEAYLAEGQRISHTGSWAWNVSSGEVFWSQEHFRIFGLDPAKVKPAYPALLQWVHPEDRAFVQQTFDRSVRERSDYALDCRIVRPDGMIRHIHSLAHPVFNESGDLSEYVGTIVDVTEQHQARAALEKAFEEIQTLKDQLYHENVALREEIDRTWMFEEIVGSSPALKSVLTRVAKVAPMDSTVLITGETGTGKELVARAIHKRSKRAGRAFIGFNCAGIPSSLIASELFGHEKGAFTGAQQRRVGRFELAEGGTIFLDEIGELPAETQIALLRVIQEREFERVGGSQPIATDVRVIAATNRDLQDAVAAGTFRLDLFYRLNVFPLEVPPLRERKEDIPMLVEYFVKRYASKTGKRIRSIDKKTVELFKCYHWPGNIRELQNVIERSVIVCDSEILSVDQSWLSKASLQPDRLSSSTLSERLLEQEKKIIESALSESKGRVSGHSGAAAKLGIPSSTLESKIKSLKIKKHDFSSE